MPLLQLGAQWLELGKLLKRTPAAVADRGRVLTVNPERFPKKGRWSAAEREMLTRRVQSYQGQGKAVSWGAIW